MKRRRLRNASLILLVLVMSLPFSSLGPLGPITAFAYTWDASVDSSHVPATWSTQTSPAFDVTLTNTGTATWPSGGANPVHAAFYFTSQNRDTINDCVGGVGYCRYALPSDIAPGGHVTIHVQKAAPFDAGAYTFDINMVQENVFWFETQTPNLPVGVAVQVKVPCGSYCTPVINSGATHYWRLNDHQNGAGPYRDVLGTMDESVIGGYAPTTSDGRLPADAEAGSASVHVAQPFQAEPNNISLNFPIGAGIPNQPAPIYALGRVG